MEKIMKEVIELMRRVRQSGAKVEYQITIKNNGVEQTIRSANVDIDPRKAEGG